MKKEHCIAALPDDLCPRETPSEFRQDAKME